MRPTGKAIIPSSAAIFIQLANPPTAVNVCPPNIAKKTYTKTSPIKAPNSGLRISEPRSNLFLIGLATV
jgi:hypothetical protein